MREGGSVTRRGVPGWVTSWLRHPGQRREPRDAWPCGPRVNRWRRLRVMRGAAVPPTPRARADAFLFRAPQPAPPRRARWRFPHRGLGTRGPRSAQARVRLRGASSGAGALRGTGPGAEGRGRRPRCHRVALSWGPSAFGSSAANCWRRYRPNDARCPRLPRHPVTRAQDACGRHCHATCTVAPAVTLTALCACPFGSRGPRSGPRARAWLPSLSGA